MALSDIIGCRTFPASIVQLWVPKFPIDWHSSHGVASIDDMEQPLFWANGPMLADALPREEVAG